MKKSVAVFITFAMVLCLALTGCGQSIDNKQQNTDSNQTAAMEREEALSIAKELVARYETYVNLGIACDFDYDYTYSEAERRAIWGLLSREQQGYLSSPQKCLCCTTYTQAKEHLLRCIDSALLGYITEDYVIYEDVLYFFMGNKGGLSYQNVCVHTFDDTKIVATADLYNSGNLYDETYEFTIEKREEQYMLTGVVEKGNIPK